MVETGKRVFVKTETLDFGSIAAGATAELVVETGLNSLVAADANPPDGFEANLMVTAFAVPARNEIQNVTTDGTGGTFNLTFDGQQTAEIGFDATAAQLEGALEALSNVVDVAVVKNGVSDWDVEFRNPGPADHPAMTADDTLLTGGITGTVVTEATKGRAPGSVLVRVGNLSAAPIDPASQAYDIICFH